MNIFNSVFVDCTASPDIAALYKAFARPQRVGSGINKIAASGSYDSYRELKQTARKRDVKYLFETNVGAGLPIINTINNLINSGDKIFENRGSGFRYAQLYFQCGGSRCPVEPGRAYGAGSRIQRARSSYRFMRTGRYPQVGDFGARGRIQGRAERCEKKSSLSPTTISKVPLLIFGKRYRNTMPSSNSIVDKSPIGVKFSVSSPRSTTAMSRWGCVKSIRLIRSSILKGVTMSYC